MVDDTNNKKSDRVAVLCASVSLSLAAIAMLSLDCRREPNVPPQVPNPSFVEFYSLSQLENAEHTVPVETSTGQTWYRMSAPLLDLSHCHLDQTRAYSRSEGDGWVHLDIEYAARDRFAEWAENHIGTSVGIFVDGNFMYSEKVLNRVWGPLAIRLSTYAEAEKVARIVRRGGVKGD